MMEQRPPGATAPGDSPPRSASGLGTAEALRQLADSVDLVFWVREVLPVDRITFLNAAFERVWGMPRQALLDDPMAWVRQIHDGDRARVTKVFDDWARQGFDGGFEVDYRIVRADGGIRWIADRGRSWRRPDGTPYRITGVAEDVTEHRLAQQRVRDSDTRFKTLVECLPHLVWSCLPDGRCDYLSPQWLAFTGVSMDEDFLGKWTEQVHPDDRRAVLDAWAVAVRVEQPYSRQYRLRRHDGVYRWFRSHAVPLHGEGGPLLRWFGTLTDITERQQAEQALHDSRAQLRSLFDHLADGLVTVAPDGRLRQWNKVARRMHGLPLDDDAVPVDEAALALFQVRTLDGVLLMRQQWPLAQLLRGEPLRDLELRVHHVEQGWEKVFSYSGELVSGADGQPILSMLQVRDVTERRRNDDQLQQLTLRLEDRVRERTADLQDAMRELEAFSYSVSHDLRAPLRAMDGFLQLLMRDHEQHLPDTGRRYLRIVHDSARKMSQLIDDLLAFSRLGQQPLRKSPVDMHALVLDVIRQLQPMQQGREVEWQVAELPACQGDLPMLRQAWFNLLSNALKYSRPRARAVIEVGADVHRERPEYFVRDNGSGFDMQHVHRLFGVFERLHRDDEFEGTGVGLALVQRIVQRHGGSIRAQGATGEGATFSFHLGTPAEARG